MITTEMFCAGHVADIQSVLNHTKFPEGALFLGESLPRRMVKPEERQDLVRFAQYKPGMDITQYTTGRIFHPLFELRWEQVEVSPTRNSGMERMYQVVYVGDERDIPIEWMPKDENKIRWVESAKDAWASDSQVLIAKVQYYYLFGSKLRERLEGVEVVRDGSVVFAEPRIPRLLYYPVPDDVKRVKLKVREYSDQASGRVCLFRYLELVDAEAKL